MYRTTLNTHIKVIGLLIVFSFLLPAFKVGGFGMKLDLILLFPLLLIIAFVDNKVKHTALFRNLGIITLLLFLNMILSDTLGLSYFKDQTGIYFPTEFIQIFSRVGVFYCFFYIARNEIISFEYFRKSCIIIFIGALVFGLLQSFNISFINEISKLYALTDTQLKGFESVNQRGFGIAGNILTWGGLSGFLFYYFYYLSDNKIIKLIGCSLALLNITISVSRSAIISLGVSFILLNLVIALFIRRNFFSFLKIFIIISILFGVAFYLFISYFPDRYDLILMRFTYMNDALNETGRGAQREFFMEFMNNDYWNYFIGIGKPLLDELGYMEMEPLFLLVAYGGIGLVLHYLLIYCSLNKVFRISKKDENLFAFVFGSTIFYLIFSLGFFFMREAHSGMIFWILMGYIIGFIYKKDDEIYS